MSLLQNVTQGLGLGQILWNDLGNGKWMRFVREIGWEGADWMHLTQGRDQWQAHVKLQVPQKAEIS
jgi:hypothetical protein